MILWVLAKHGHGYILEALIVVSLGLFKQAQEKQHIAELVYKCMEQ